MFPCCSLISRIASDAAETSFRISSEALKSARYSSCSASISASSASSVFCASERSRSVSSMRSSYAPFLCFCCSRSAVSLFLFSSALLIFSRLISISLFRRSIFFSSAYDFSLLALIRPESSPAFSVFSEFSRRMRSNDFSASVLSCVKISMSSMIFFRRSSAKSIPSTSTPTSMPRSSYL